jgi:hypothetical protein
MKDEVSKSRSAPRREELDVGLARHEKAKSGSAWRLFIEFGGWWFTGLLVLVVIALLYFTSLRNVDSNPDLGPSAVLGIIGAPKKIWEEGATTKVKSVQVRVGNQGKSRADNVRVTAVASTSRAPLSGPAQIESGQSGLFAGEVGVVLRPGQDLQIVLECSNCRQ